MERKYTVISDYNASRCEEELEMQIGDGVKRCKECQQMFTGAYCSDCFDGCRICEGPKKFDTQLCHECMNVMKQVPLYDAKHETTIEHTEKGEDLSCGSFIETLCEAICERTPHNTVQLATPKTPIKRRDDCVDCLAGSDGTWTPKSIHL